MYFTSYNTHTVIGPSFYLDVFLLGSSRGSQDVLIIYSVMGGYSEYIDLIEFLMK